MRKKLIAVLFALAVVPIFAGCSAPEPVETTKYTINAQLSADNRLTATVVCDYVNGADVPLKEVWFHLYPNAFRDGAKYSPVAKNRIQDAYPNGKSYAILNVTGVRVDGRDTAINITGDDENILAVALGRTLEPTEKTRITIDYAVKLPNIRHRFGYTEKSVNLADFYPIACVYRGGGFVSYPYYSTGDPFFSDIADYDVTLTVPSGLECAFTGSVKNKRQDDSGCTYNIEARAVRDFAAVCGKYDKLSGKSGATNVDYLYYADGDPEKSLAAAIDSIRVFGNLFGAYPYAQYTVVQTGFLQGGMEYPCLSMISDAYSGNAKLDIIVHETAHQWWYGVVGNDEVRYAWLDEGLAEYSTMMFYEHAQGYSYTFDGKRADALGAYIMYCETYKNNGLGDTTMTRAVNEYGDETEYSYMTYVKGALMFDDIRNTIGTPAFISGLKRYYSENKYKIAEPQNIIGAMEKASSRSLEPVFRSWLDGNVKLFSSH